MGVNELETGLTSVVRQEIQWCSTPMGVNELETAIPGPCFSRVVSAQRLWALTN